MGWYIAKLLVLLPLFALLMWGSLKLTARMNSRLGMASARGRCVRIVETTVLAPGLKLAVIEFHGREILVSASRTGLTRLAEAAARPAEPEKDNAPAGPDEQGQPPVFRQILERLLP